MTKVLIAMFLLVAVAAAQDAKVTPLMTQDLAGILGKEGTMVTVAGGSLNSKSREGLSSHARWHRRLFALRDFQRLQKGTRHTAL